MILAGCAWLFSFCELSVAIPLTIVLLGYIVNTVVFSWLKGMQEGTRLEVVFSICYTAVFAILLVIGCIINIKIHLIMMAIILVVTAICVWIRNWVASEFLQIFALTTPIVVFVYFLAYVPWLATIFKVIIPIIYILFVPFISYYEDCSAAQNIFELVYDNTWSPEYEKSMRELDNSDKDIVV